ncbi:hypothetical protein IMSAGC004_00214 [Bacteroidaceae bacterium]|nr:hypothetical protein IMSAGC004_00214 [Bacteroidaceae bacterium]
MSIDKSNFKFQSHYIGLWSRIDAPEEQLSGTLFIDQQKIWIELCCIDSEQGLPENIGSLNGCTYSIDDTGKESAVNIFVEGLSFVRYFHSGSELNLMHYTFSVDCIYIYEGELHKDKIGALTIRATILDKWASPIMTNAYHNEVFKQLPLSHHAIYFISPSPYTLLRSSDFFVAIKFHCKYQIGGINQGIEQCAFLYLSSHRKCSFLDFQTYVNQFHYLFFLLTNRIHPIDYMYCEDGCNTFVYKPNEQQLCRYIVSHDDPEPATTSDDFSTEELQSIFLQWIELYNKYSDAINTFFETLTNIYTSPASQIKNFISSIDALTKGINGNAGIVHPNSNRAKTLEAIFNRNVLTPDEKNRLKGWLLQVKGTELKPRFSKMLERISQYIPANLGADFVEKIVNTKNNITHPYMNETFCFNSNEYRKVSYELNYIIRAYLLVSIGVKESIITKLLGK